MKIVPRYFIIDIFVWTVDLLLFDLVTVNQFILERSREGLRWDDLMYAGSVDLDTPSRGSGKVTHVTPEDPVTVVDPNSDFVVFDHLIRVDVAEGFPRVERGIIPPIP